MKLIKTTTLKEELEASALLQKLVGKAVSLEIRSIDSKLANTERMFQICMDKLESIEKRLNGSANEKHLDDSGNDSGSQQQTQEHDDSQ